MADNLSLVVVNQDDVSHAYTIQGGITTVLSNASGNTTQLSGSALQAFEANSTWWVISPNGTASSFPGVGNWSFPVNAVSTIDAGASGAFHVEYENSAASIVEVTLTVTQICPDAGGSSPQTYSVQIYGA